MTTTEHEVTIPLSDEQRLEVLRALLDRFGDQGDGRCVLCGHATTLRGTVEAAGGEEAWLRGVWLVWPAVCLDSIQATVHVRCAVSASLLDLGNGRTGPAFVAARDAESPPPGLENALVFEALGSDFETAAAGAGTIPYMLRVLAWGRRFIARLLS